MVGWYTDGVKAPKSALIWISYYFISECCNCFSGFPRVCSFQMPVYPSCTLDTLETQKLEMRGGKVSSELERLKNSRNSVSRLASPFHSSPLSGFIFSEVLYGPPYTVHAVEGPERGWTRGKEITAPLYWRLGVGTVRGHEIIAASGEKAVSSVRGT